MMYVRRGFRAFRNRWMKQALSLSRWQASATLAISALLLMAAADDLLHPLAYIAGDLRGSSLFNAVIVGLLGLAGFAGLAMSCTALFRRR